jgi:hypothetical protein
MLAIAIVTVKPSKLKGAPPNQILTHQSPSNEKAVLVRTQDRPIVGKPKEENLERQATHRHRN